MMVKLTPDNQGPVVSIVTWVLICAVLLVSGMKCTLAASSIGLHLDDLFVLVATALSIGQSVATSFQVHYGLGRLQSSLSAAELQHYQESAYTGQILFILVCLVSKVTVLIFLRQITPIRSHRRAIHTLGGFICLGSAAALLASCFQCQMPQPWAILSDKCFNMTAFWTAFGGFNILSELFLIALPVYIIWNVRLDMNRKAIVLATFAMRVFVIAASAVKMSFLQKLMYLDRSQLTFDSWPYFLSCVVVQSISVITVSIPSLKIVLMGLDSGMLSTGSVSWSSHRSHKINSQALRASASFKSRITPLTRPAAVRWPSSKSSLGNRSSITGVPCSGNLHKLHFQDLEAGAEAELEIFKSTHITVEMTPNLTS